LSRGAASCVFVDDNRQACAAITENLAKTRLDGGRVVKADVTAFLKRDAASYDLIFADPPYWKHHGDVDHLGKLLCSDLLAPRLAADAWLVSEVSAHHTPPDAAGLELADRRRYGSSAILFHRPCHRG
jgi:16S rRNA (guanine966-N2)-methyltransferase